MSTDLHHPDVERQLREAFTRQAASAPLPNPTLGDLPYVTVLGRDPLRRPHPRRRLVVVAAAAAALIGVLIVSMSDARQGTPAFQPDGTEVVLAPTTVPDDFVFGGDRPAIDPASVVAVQVEGHPTLVRYTTVGFHDGALVQWRCMGSSGSFGCSSDWNWGAPDLTWTSSVDNREAAFNLYLWANVPDGAAYVAWRSPSGPMWQRPVAGIVAFPYTDSVGDAPVVAFDADGNTLDVITQRTYYERMGTPPGGWRTDPTNPEFLGIDKTDNLSSDQRNELNDLANDTVRDCLATGSWNACVDEARQVVDARFDELGGELVPYVYEDQTDQPATADHTISATTTP